VIPNKQSEDWGAFISQINSGQTYSKLISMANRLNELYSNHNHLSLAVNIVQTRIALIGNYTLSFLQTPLEVHLAQYGIRADFFTGDFNNYEQELLTTDSTMYAFEPQVVLFLMDHRAIDRRPSMNASPNEVKEMADRQLYEWELKWEKVRSICGASIIQTNIALPAERVFGHYEAKAEWSESHYYRRLNQLLAERTPNHVSICDAEHLSACFGKWAWFDEPIWYSSRQSMGFGAVATLSYNLAAIVAALLGKSRKCLVLDLDNTLWGGVVGDAGVEGLRLGRGDAIGEGFIDFQHYCRQLKERGVLLAICSKNNQEIARSAFEMHPEMVLKLEDFSAFTANWDDKVTNLRRIASQLNLGLDSFVFVDDNPAERALVRMYLPEVAVPELPEDPALFRRTLDQQRYFEVNSVSTEDLSRTNYYLAEQKRKEYASASTDMPEFLKSLEQVCSIGPFDEMNLKRIVQLINKTNQWNLTTQRLTEEQVRICMTDPSCYTLWVRHRDRFGDTGLISVLIARENDSDLNIETWLMSCRVINRGIEAFVFNEVLDEARRRGMISITGVYHPTSKNAMVSGLYKDLGFEKVKVEEGGTTLWRLKFTEDVLQRPHHITSETRTVMV